MQGPAEYTPTDFRVEELKGNSYAHELAQAVVYTSPLFVYSGSPTDYLASEAVDIIKRGQGIWPAHKVASRRIREINEQIPVHQKLIIEGCEGATPALEIDFASFGDKYPPRFRSGRLPRAENIADDARCHSGRGVPFQFI